MANSQSIVRTGDKLPPGGLPLVMPVKRLDAYVDPIKLFRTTFGNMRTQTDRDWLLRVVLEACRSAENYIASNIDENKTFRRNDAAARRSLRDQDKAILTLSAFAREHDRQSGFALALASFRGRGEQDEGKNLSVAFIDMLSDYQRALATTTRKAGPWIHRVVCANLIFPKPIDDRRRHPSVGMGLLFHLVLLLRNYTADMQSFARHQPGEPMPSHGDPHYRLAGDFVHVATGEEIRNPGASLRKLIKENSGLGLVQWPAERR
jgi:hypothetical protein